MTKLETTQNLNTEIGNYINKLANICHVSKAGMLYQRDLHEKLDELIARMKEVYTIQKKPDWLLHYKWLSENSNGDLSQIKEMYEKACKELGYGE